MFRVKDTTACRDIVEVDAISERVEVVAGSSHHEIRLKLICMSGEGVTFSREWCDGAVLKRETGSSVDEKKHGKRSNIGHRREKHVGEAKREIETNVMKDERVK